ncbi:MAG TPA: flagellar export chaperone FliS [Anaerolineaceae bacterium]
MYQQAYRQEYRTQDVVGATPIRLVVMAYDLAIRACEQEDFVKANQAVSALRDALDFDYPDVSVGLFRLYQFCLDCIRSGDYHNALTTLRELRDAWATVEKRLSPVSSAQPATHPSQVRVSFAS